MKNLSTDPLYTGRITAPDADYTYGSSKNETSPGAGDGTPYELGRANDVFGLQQALLRSAGIAPNGNADTQLVCEQLEALVELASGRAVNYDESGIVNAYVLDVQAGQQGPRSYFNGLMVEFTPTTPNTLASTINVNLIGTVAILDSLGNALVGGELVVKTTLVYQSGAFRIYKTPIKSYAGFSAGSVIYIHDDFAVDDLFNAATALVDGVWESVGPTGAGADNLWTALDIVPKCAKALIVNLNMQVSGSTISDSYNYGLYCRRGGSVETPGGNVGLMTAAFTNAAGSFERANGYIECRIPIDNTNVFDLQSFVAGTTPGKSATMWLKGWIE